MNAQRKLDQLKAFKEKRNALRDRFLMESLLGQNTPLTYSAEFDGYGDSGSTHAATGNGEVDELLCEAVNLFVTFDWYNNKGGGGDITWDVRKDKIIINGYYNVTEKVDAMTEEEF